MNTIISLLVFGLALIVLTKLTIAAVVKCFKKILEISESDETEETHEFEVTENTVCSSFVSIPCYSPENDTVYIWGKRGVINHSCYIHESTHSKQGIFIKLYSLLIPSTVVQGEGGLPLLKKIYAFIYTYTIGVFHSLYVFAVELATYLETRKKCMEIGIWSDKVNLFHSIGLLTYIINVLYSMLYLGLTLTLIYSLIK